MSWNAACNVWVLVDGQPNSGEHVHVVGVFSTQLDALHYGLFQYVFASGTRFHGMEPEDFGLTCPVDYESSSVVDKIMYRLRDHNVYVMQTDLKKRTSD